MTIGISGKGNNPADYITRRGIMKLIIREEVNAIAEY